MTEKKDFYFLGKAPLSKSLLNRALIIKSWFPHFSIQGESQCEDISIMSNAIKNLDKKKDFYCGFSGTAFRFLSIRMSREKGQFLFKGEEALFHRPLKEISILLSQLSVDIKKTTEGYLISSEGWKTQGDCLNIPSQKTSQYASALILNSWNLDQDLYFSINQNMVSYPYFEMTLDFVKKLGLIIKQNESEFFIPKNQTLKTKTYTPEQDKSCLFALACFAVLKGKAFFLDWEKDSLQPDNIFPEILKMMGVQVGLKNEKLSIFKCENLKPLIFNLKGSPDLFPLLAILCAKAEGFSELSGLSHLAFKESNRLKKIKELLKLCNIKIELHKNKCLIFGQKIWPKTSPFLFDTKKDHRMVMVAELIASLRVPITIKGKHSINKSFPEFYSLISSH